ncbi:hypothetical protein NMY22_g2764 [Coprinellus aureogranulatus]|nr:hypothetical protein NMY22_g2764 [Coprinellus aureogranulatus]
MEKPDMDVQRKIDERIALLEQELLELKRQRNDLSPVSATPPEILCQILLLATTPEDDSEMRKIERDIGTLCHVSHSWRATALGSPELWADINVGMATNPKQVEFMLKHAFPHPVTLRIDGTPNGQHSQLRALEAVVCALSGEDTVHQLAAIGSSGLLTSLLGVVNLRTLRTLQLVKDTSIFGDGATDASLAQSLLFSPETSSTQLRDLYIEGFSIPLTSPILNRSLQVTTLSLPIPPDSNLSLILDMLRNLLLIQQLGLRFVEPLRPSQAVVNPVRLNRLSRVAFTGDSAAIISVLSYLRLSAMTLNLDLSCELRSHINPQQEGANLFRVIGAAQCHPTTDGKGPAPKRPFSPHIIALGDLSSKEEGLMNMVLNDWMSFDDISEDGAGDHIMDPSASISVVFREHGRPIEWARWNPLVVTNDPKELGRLTGWSMEELRLFCFLDHTDYSASLWQLLAKCPSITNLALHSAHIPKLVALHSEVRNPIVLPFLSLQELEVSLLRHMETFQQGDPALPVGEYYRPLLEPLYQALTARQFFYKTRGIEKEWVIHHLNLVDDRIRHQDIVHRVAQSYRVLRLVEVTTF